MGMIHFPMISIPLTFWSRNEGSLMNAVLTRALATTGVAAILSLSGLIVGRATVCAEIPHAAAGAVCSVGIGVPDSAASRAAEPSTTFASPYGSTVRSSDSSTMLLAYAD